MIWLSENTTNFPSIEYVSEEGIIAIGGDLSSERLVNAYKNGIFPWYNEGEPILWYCPNPRMVLFFEQLHVSKSMKQLLRKNTYRITFNQAFEEVIFNCKKVERYDGLGTWITDDMQKAYIALHKKGIAKSVEVWRDSELVGGLYGMDLGNIFCGESMFSKESNTSKIAFIHLAQKLERENYLLLDCQVYNKHLESLGAEEIPREFFLKLLKNTNKKEL